LTGKGQTKGIINGLVGQTKESTNQALQMRQQRSNPMNERTDANKIADQKEDQKGKPTRKIQTAEP